MVLQVYIDLRLALTLTHTHTHKSAHLKTAGSAITTRGDAIIFGNKKNTAALSASRELGSSIDTIVTPLPPPRPTPFRCRIRSLVTVFFTDRRPATGEQHNADLCASITDRQLSRSAAVYIVPLLLLPLTLRRPADLDALS